MNISSRIKLLFYIKYIYFIYFNKIKSIEYISDHECNQFLSLEIDKLKSQLIVESNKIRPLKKVAHSLPLYKSQKIKIALHIMRENSSIPWHDHKDALAIVLVCQGKLNVNQWSHLGNRRLMTLNTGENHITFPNGWHQLRALTPDTRFLSLHFNTVARNPCGKTMLFPKALICSLALSVHSPKVLADAVDCINAAAELSSECETRAPLDKAFVDSLITQAKNDDALAQFELAQRYRQGCGVTQNMLESAYWYKQLSLQRDVEAQYQLGLMHLDGQGVTEDSVEALRLIAAASDQGHVKAQKVLNHILSTDEVLDC